MKLPAVARSALVVALACAPACTRESPGTTPASPDPTPSAKSTTDVQPTTTAIEGPLACMEIRRRFADRLRTATMACKSAEDCGCYNPVSDASCGGVVDAPTSEALAKIETDFHAAKCPWLVQCGPWVCKPSCVAGRCQR
jgi:hypothetical protein